MTFDYKQTNKYDNPVDPKRCKATVAGGRATIYQCQKPRGPDGYCSVHGKKGQEKRAEKAEARSRQWSLKLDISAARTRIIAAAIKHVEFCGIEGPLHRAVAKLKKLQAQVTR